MLWLVQSDAQLCAAMLLCQIDTDVHDFGRSHMYHQPKCIAGAAFALDHMTGSYLPFKAGVTSTLLLHLLLLLLLLLRCLLIYCR
jgi:hypothetical protein